MLHNTYVFAMITICILFFTLPSKQFLDPKNSIVPVNCVKIMHTII